MSVKMFNLSPVCPAAFCLSDFDYVLPQECIALYPNPDRSAARLMRIDRQTGTVEHGIFRDLAGILARGDVLVLNDTKVIPARLYGKKTTGGQVETFLLRRSGENRWNALLRPGRRAKKGTVLTYGANDLSIRATVLDDAQTDSCERLLEFEAGVSWEDLKRVGHVPLPPYINRPDEAGDRESYQTVFADQEGAVAAPTAGLHFDRPLLDALRKKGVEIVYVTLHVGYGTFQTIQSENLAEHRMHQEAFELSVEAAEKINSAKAASRRVIACGTTVVRTLESCAGENGRLSARRGQTGLFIYPPYSFKAVDGMITNFHLPKSSLLLLVAAFLGKDKMFAAYDEAVRRRYQFYSYGDAMFIA